MNRRIVGPLVAGLAFAALYASPASADLVFSLDTGTSLGAGSYGTVTLSQEAAGVVEVKVNLSSGVGFVDTGAGGKNILLFDITGNPTITETDFNNTTDFAAGTTSSGQSIHADGSGNWQYSAACTAAGCSNGGSNPNPGPLSFDVTATGLTPNSFASNGTGFFAADICTAINTTTGGCSGKTGVVFAPGSGVPVPEPTTLALFGAGLMGLGAIGRIARRAKGRAA